MEIRTKIKMAREGLYWSQKKLAELSGVSQNSIAKLESGLTGHPKEETINRVCAPLFRSGVTFTDHGVEIKSDYAYEIKGKYWFEELLENVYDTLKDEDDATLYINGSDDAESPPQVIELYRKIRASGVRMKQIIGEGNLYLLAPNSEYRWKPKEHFNNWITLVYGDKVARTTDYDNGCVVRVSEKNAISMLSDFELMFSLLKEPEGESIAPIKF